MTMMKTLLGATTALAIGTAAALAEPGLIIDLGGKFDKSFNESAYTGAQKWIKDNGGKYKETELQSEAQREQSMRRMAESGANPVVVLGFANMSTLAKVAPDYPETNFAIIDGVVEGDNVKSVVFKEHEGSFLVGVAAAMASKSDTVSFVGGMDIPLISRFACGYAQGVKAVKPEATVIVNMTGTTPAAWNDPVKGGELTRAQIAQGSDVVYAAAGGTGVGVLQAAADAGIYSIGVDSNQNYLHPGQVLTSMLKRVDNAVYAIFDEEEFSSGFQVMGLDNEGVDWALDEHNAEIVSESMQATVAETKAKIIAGEIVVHDYMSDNSCPAF